MIDVRNIIPQLNGHVVNFPTDVPGGQFKSCTAMSYNCFGNVKSAPSGWSGRVVGVVSARQGPRVCSCSGLSLYGERCWSMASGTAAGWCDLPFCVSCGPAGGTEKQGRHACDVRVCRKPASVCHLRLAWVTGDTRRQVAGRG